MDEKLVNALRASIMVDSNHPAMVAFADKASAGVTRPNERARRLYYAVRDGFRYDPYKVDLSIDGLKASRVLADGHGWCVPKAALFAAACRAVGLPARVGLADVRKLSTARLREVMGTDMSCRHGYTAIYLDGAWRKATPAFNVELCHRLGVYPLEFDGAAASIYHPFDVTGRRHMEYVAMHGERDDIPREDLLQVFAKHYPCMPRLDVQSWDDDVASEAERPLGQTRGETSRYEDGVG